MRFSDWNDFWISKDEDIRRFTTAVINRYRSHEDPDAIVSEVYLRGVKRVLDEEKDPLDETRVLSFTFRMIHNALVSRFRRAKADRKKREELGRRNSPVVPDGHFRPFDQVERLRLEFLLRLESCWQAVKLTSRERFAVWFWIESEMTRHIALEMLDISYADRATQQRLYDAPLCRARRKLRWAFAPLGDLVAELGALIVMHEIAPFLRKKLIESGMDAQLADHEILLCCC